jgi:hypothetical protein
MKCFCFGKVYKVTNYRVTQTPITIEDNSGENSIMPAWPDASQNPEVVDPFAIIPVGASDIEVYQLFASEMFDPSIFENNTYGAANWDGMMM